MTGFPHGIALFGLPFLVTGAWCLLMSIQGSRVPTPPAARRDGWFRLREQGTIAARFWFYAAATIAWCLYFALVISDYWMLNSHRFDLFCSIVAPAGAAMGIVGIVLTWRYWRLKQDFLDAELCTDTTTFRPGQSIELRLRQPLGRPLRIDQIAVGAVCMRSDQVKTSSSVSYPPAVDVANCWKTPEVERSYAAGAEVSARAALALPADASASSPSRSRNFPIFQWFIVLRVQAEGEPQLKVEFPIVVEPRAGDVPAADTSGKSELIYPRG
jgi:hypothetical protein